jgi:hypothetical protein
MSVTFEKDRDNDICIVQDNKAVGYIWENKTIYLGGDFTLDELQELIREITKSKALIDDN